MTEPASRPLLLMDVDGVLNAFGAWDRLLAGLDPTGDEDGPTLRPARADGYHLLINRDHARWLARLESLFEIVWATMWQERAPAAFAPHLGIGDTWPWIDFSHYATSDVKGRTGAGVAGYKFPGVLATVGERPAVWVDDDLDPFHHEWAEARTAAGIPTLVVQPFPDTGWTRAEFEQVLAFGQSLSESEEWLE